MRLNLLLALLFLFSILPFNLSAQQKKISLNLVNVPVSNVLSEIEKKSDYSFIVNQQLVDLNRKVDAVFTNTSVKDILDQLFSKEKITIVVSYNQIILTPLKSEQGEDAGLKRKITGKVTDAKTKEPLPGVTILIKGTTTGTTTGIDGTYTIEVTSPEALLVFSYLGYTTVEYPVKSIANILNVELFETSQEIEGVVVTALGIKREEKALGYAVQKVDGRGLQTVRTVDVGTSLSGKVAGLSVLNSSEFAAAPEMYIRGEKPLLVIDGVPYGNMTLRDIQPDDIESLSILKGATASALYGYRGSSGAIMVTTKKGIANKGLAISINSSTMFAAGFLAIPESQSTYGRVVNTATNTTVTNGDGAWGPPLEGQEVNQWDPISRSYKPMPYLPVGKNNFRNFLEPGYVLNNNINIVQQSDFGSFRASASWVKNKGQYPNSMFDKYTYNIGGDMKLKKFTLTSNISYNKQVSPNFGFSGYTSYDPMYSLLIWSSPDWNVLDYQNYWVVPNEVQNTSYTDSNNNPYFDRYERTHSLNKDIFNGSLALMYDLTPWLKATIRSGFDTYSNRQVIQISKGSLVSAGSATVIENGDQVWGESKLGSYNLGLGRGYSFNNDLIISANKTFEKFTVEGLAGGTIFYRQDEGTDSRTMGGLSIPGFYSLKASVLPAYVESNLYRQQVNSMFGRVSLSWNSMVYAEATARNDWSSTLSEATRSYFYPSVSGSFVASELLPEIKWLSLWKLRGSWTSSKAPAGIYDINQVFSITNNAWGTLPSASLPATIYSMDVFPESASTWEIGTAVNLYNNRISADIAYYNKRMYDFLEKAGITPATGYYNSYVNTDEEVTRKGVEITLNATPVKTNDLQWNVSVNWSKYARYYTKLDSIYTPDKPWIKVGERFDAYVLYDFQYDPDGNIIHSNGVPLFSDYPSKWGNYDPDWIWGVNTSLRYKNWNFSLSFDGRVGGIAQTTTEMYMWRSGSHPNSVTPERYLDATVPGSKNYIGEGVKVISGSATYDTYGNITSDDRVYAPNDVAVTYESYINTAHSGTAWGGSPSPLEAYSTTFFKVREMSLSYDLPKNLCNRLKSQGISVSAVGQNMYLWAKQFKYSDPDGGYENFSDPSIRYVGFNMKFNF